MPGAWAHDRRTAVNSGPTAIWAFCLGGTGGDEHRSYNLFLLFALSLRRSLTWSNLQLNITDPCRPPNPSSVARSPIIAS